MKYSTAAHVVNSLFIALIFVGPIGYCLFNPDIPTEVGRSVIALTFMLGAFVIADWYHYRFSNSIGGIVKTISIGIILALGSVATGSLTSKASAMELALFRDPSAWSDLGLLLTLYVVGAGVSAAAVVSVPRFLIITRLFKQVLPTEHSD